MSEKATQYKPGEAYELLKRAIIANDKIISNGELPVAFSVIGSHGIGKTTVIREVVQDLGKDFYKLNLAQITEPAELIGHYSKEYEVQKGELSEWVTENMIPDFYKMGYTRTGLLKTTPCPPDFIVRMKKGGVLCLDDFSRGNQLLMQSVMEICNEGTMIGWDLKDKGIQVILSENPSDGEYNVQDVDNAHSSRIAKIHMIWDAKDWAARAEKIKTDERLINFVLWCPELLEKKKQDGISSSGNVDPRSMDKFFRLISTIDNFEKHLDEITEFGSSTVGRDVTSQLINFVNKRLDKLPSIDKLIKEWDLPVAKGALTECCGDSEKDSSNWKSATAAILTTRMYNYMRYNQKNVTKGHIKQYLELILHPSFSVDQKYLLVKQTMQCGNQFPQILAGEPRFIKYMTS